MQTPEQVQVSTKKGVAPWKVVASVATVAAFGFGGMAIADPGGSDADNPPPIEIQDQRSAGNGFTPGTQPDWEVVGSPSFSGDDLDSPLASADLDSPANDSSPDVQSPDPASPDVQSADVSSADVASADVDSPAADSPDVASPDVDSPAADSPDVASPDVDDSVDSPDGSVDSADGSVDSP